MIGITNLQQLSDAISSLEGREFYRLQGANRSKIDIVQLLNFKLIDIMTMIKNRELYINESGY